MRVFTFEHDKFILMWILLKNRKFLFIVINSFRNYVKFEIFIYLQIDASFFLFIKIITLINEFNLNSHKFNSHEFFTKLQN